MRLKTILIAAAAIALSFLLSLKLMDWVSPRGNVPAPALAQLPPLPPVSRNSRIVVPIAITLSAIRDSADRAAPRNFAGKSDNPVQQILQNADINWSVARGAIAASGSQNTLVLAAPLNGALNVTGSLSVAPNSQLSGALGNLLGGNVAKQLGSINIKQFNANAEIRGNVGVVARPALAANWRIEPNLAAQVTLGDTAVSVAGIKLSVPTQIKPLIDKAVNDQLGNLQQRLRNDPMLEQVARREWIKICRSIPLQNPSAGVPELWLEIRPVKALAAQPRIDSNAVTLTLGVEAESRITPAQTKPACPFPATLDIVP